MMRRAPPRWRFMGAAALVAIAALAGGADGRARQAAALTQTDRTDIARAEAYLDSVRSLRSNFVQTASHGGVAEGTIYIQRPGRMRIDYRPPTPLQLYADGTWLIYLDRELEQVNQVPLSATPAAFLVRDRISLSGDVAVERVTRRRGTIELHLRQADDGEAGRLIVRMAAEPLGLRGWTVIDAQGVETTVTLIDPAINPQIDPRTLLYSPPDWSYPSSQD
jgi:outer membrane lipoprotein-sorting protein